MNNPDMQPASVVPASVLENIKACGVVVVMLVTMMCAPLVYADHHNESANKSSNNGGANSDNPVIEIDMPNGKLRIQLFREHAPLAVAKLIELVKAGYYDKDTVYESRPTLGFVIAKTGKTARPLEYKEESNTLASQRGSFAISKPSVSKAYLNNLFIGYGRQPELEKHYFIIGQVVEGLEQVEKNMSREVQSVRSFNLVESGQPVKELTNIMVNEQGLVGSGN